MTRVSALLLDEPTSSSTLAQRAPRGVPVERVLVFSGTPVALRHSMDFKDVEEGDEPGRCFDCGAPAPWIILLAGEDEKLHEAWACEVHAKGHWRRALVTPPAAEVVIVEEATDARCAS